VNYFGVGLPARPTSRALFAALALALGACATVSTAPAPPAASKPAVAPPSLGLLSRIKVPSDREPVLQLSARGAQVFRCEARDGVQVWVFRQPDADLLNDRGAVVGKHGANQSFEHSDGSRLTATIVANDEAPRASDLRWLLLSTRSYGKGAFEGVTQVQRVNTSGGMPPDRCDKAQANSVLRVDFTADFIFYRPKSASPG
jgi:hypothetical protein